MEVDHRWDVGPAEARTPLLDGSEVVGAVVPTRAGVRPVYVSVRVSLDTAVAWGLRCAPRYRLPETTRAAHRLADQLPSRGSPGRPVRG